jgi:hypothetical protein
MLTAHYRAMIVLDYDLTPGADGQDRGLEDAACAVEYRSRMASCPGTDDALEKLAAVSLEELESVALLDRVDLKYVLCAEQVAALIARLPACYRVLEIGSRRVHAYRSLYFDSADLELYRAHHDGRAVRVKVRSRTYLDSRISYFEVKQKDGRGRTSKRRIATPGLLTEIDDASRKFVDEHSPRSLRALDAVLLNEFLRITLASTGHGERVTIDLGLRFQVDGEERVLPGLAVAELKRSGPAAASPFVQAMRALGIRPSAFSKYCVGTALLRRDVRYNRFKPQLRLVEKLTGEHR